MKCEGFSGPCGKYKAVRFRMNTNYIDRERNYRVLCPSCQQESGEFWDEQWSDYYRGCL
jgi:hypothetical protein